MYLLSRLERVEKTDTVPHIKHIMAIIHCVVAKWKLGGLFVGKLKLLKKLALAPRQTIVKLRKAETIDSRSQCIWHKPEGHISRKTLMHMMNNQQHLLHTD